VAYSKMADEIAALLLAEAKSQSVDIGVQMRMFDTVLDAPMPEDARMCRVQGATTAFTKWITKEVPA
jgi:nuclear pore complex protein Nup98-Nup96